MVTIALPVVRYQKKTGCCDGNVKALAKKFDRDKKG
jgi:hypothetical protein